LVASEAMPGLLQRVWAKMDYQFDVCHVTKEDTWRTCEVWGEKKEDEER